MGPIPSVLGPIRVMVCGSQGPIRKWIILILWNNTHKVTSRFIIEPGIDISIARLSRAIKLRDIKSGFQFITFLIGKYLKMRGGTWKIACVKSQFNIFCIVYNKFSKFHSAGTWNHTSLTETLRIQSPQNLQAPSQYKDRLIYVWRFPC